MKIRSGEINLYVLELDLAARFYRDALDFELFESGEGYRKLRHPGFTLTLFRAQGEGRGDPPGASPSMTADMLIDEIDAAIVRIAACGGKAGPIRPYEGGRTAPFQDPDGISWELISPRDPGE